MTISDRVKLYERVVQIANNLKIEFERFQIEEGDHFVIHYLLKDGGVKKIHISNI